MLELIFWGAISIVIYTYLGYPALASLLAWIIRRRTSNYSQLSPLEDANLPTVTLIIAAYNEESIIAKKLENSLALDYPRNKLEIVVAADGSTDRTCEIVRQYTQYGVTLHWQPERRGKAAALNRVVPLTKGEIIVFSDANAMYDKEALRKLVRHFANPKIGCVAGAKKISQKSVTGAGEGLYWRYESHLKQCDTLIGSMMGAPGEIFAIRRDLYEPVEEDSLIEDFIISMRIIAKGYKAVYEPEAISWEEASSSLKGEWQRRTRISAGGIQAILRLKGMLNPSRGRLAFQYLSHRVLRWVITPWLLPLGLIINTFLAYKTPYNWLLIGQLLFYGGALIGWLGAYLGKLWFPFYFIFYFCMLNAAAIVGCLKYLTGRQPVAWSKARE
ncbi:MAG: glycosyltransferase family 2 protein [Chloroflexi bacterium]|nr:MAG: glycosyltransferase family 2 protein [Chloroflexota bacterium]HDN78963.1 glycosyltransferase family 2 protein [Chloroflexota bacterium]